MIFLSIIIVTSAWKSRDFRSREMWSLSFFADSSSSFIVNNLAGAHSVGERSEIGMPSVQEVCDQPGVSLQPEVAIFKRWLTWSRWKKNLWTYVWLMRKWENVLCEWYFPEVGHCDKYIIERVSSVIINAMGNVKAYNSSYLHTFIHNVLPCGKNLQDEYVTTQNFINKIITLFKLWAKKLCENWFN